MAQTFTATANSSSTIGYALYGSTSWSTGSSNGACQGAYQGTTAAKSRVGIMVFTNAGTTLKGKVIQSIKFSITCSAAGSSSSSKVLTFKQAKYQSPASGLKGSDVVGTTLGTLTGKFYNNTTTHKYYPSYIPEPFEFSHIDDLFSIAFYNTKDGRAFQFSEFSDADYSSINIDEGNAFDVYINDCSGIAISNGEYTNITWCT